MTGRRLATVSGAASSAVATTAAVGEPAGDVTVRVVGTEMVHPAYSNVCVIWMCGRSALAGIGVWHRPQRILGSLAVDRLFPYMR